MNPNSLTARIFKARDFPGGSVLDADGGVSFFRMEILVVGQRTINGRTALACW